MKRFFTLMLFFLLVVSLAAEQKKDFQIYPVITYSEETDFSFGGVAYYTHRPNYLKKDLPPNSVYSNMFYSLNEQFIGYVEPNFQLKKGRYSLSFPLKYQKWPSKFYGIGNNSVEENVESYTPEIFEGGVNLTSRFKKRFSITAIIKAEKISMLKKEKNGLLSTSELSGKDGGLNFGTGISFVYNSRDNSFYPIKGERIEFMVVHSDKLFLSDYTFTKYELDLRKYISLDSKQILAFQHIFSYSAQNPPFQEYSHLGSAMRAYDANRFLDKHKAILRGEYRVFPWEYGFKKRLGFVAFVETGQVSNNLQEFALSELKFSFGVGARISLIPSEKLNLKIDYAHAKDSSGINFSGQEAF